MTRQCRPLRHHDCTTCSATNPMPPPAPHTQQRILIRAAANTPVRAAMRPGAGPNDDLLRVERRALHAHRHLPQRRGRRSAQHRKAAAGVAYERRVAIVASGGGACASHSAAVAPSGGRAAAKGEQSPVPYLLIEALSLDLVRAIEERDLFGRRATAHDGVRKGQRSAVSALHGVA